MLLLSRTDVLGLLNDDAVIAAVESGHADHAMGRLHQPSRPTLRLAGLDSIVIPMMAAVPNPPTAVVKILADVPGNTSRGMPWQQSTIVVVDMETGRCDAVLEGSAVTLFRTAAASAVATRHLARNDSHVLGLVGAGAQAAAHLRALRRVRSIDAVLVWSRSTSSAQSFVASQSNLEAEISIAASVEEVVCEADIVCTLTPSKSPVLLGRWLRPGMHLNVVGAPPRAQYREIDTEAVVRSQVVVDSISAAMEESGDLLIPLQEGSITSDHVDTELGDVISGRRPGRRSPVDITLYKSVGVGLQDAVTAQYVLARARSRGVGLEVDLRNGPDEYLSSRASALR